MNITTFNYYIDTATMRKLPEMVVGMLDKHQTVEEPCNGKLLSTVLKTNGIGNNPVEFNNVHAALTFQQL